MKTMVTAFRFSVLAMLLGGLVYPLAMTVLSQCVFPVEANGSLIRKDDGMVIGSELLGQSFTKPEYFHSRPSVNSYDGANSGGSNFGATSQKLISRITQDTAAYRQTNQWEKPVPIDAVTASASSLDPHISLANALAQVPRVAQARQIPQVTVHQRVMEMAEDAFAESPYVNVLRLNLALDRQ